MAALPLLCSCCLPAAHHRLPAAIPPRTRQELGQERGRSLTRRHVRVMAAAGSPDGHPIFGSSTSSRRHQGSSSRLPAASSPDRNPSPEGSRRARSTPPASAPSPERTPNAAPKGRRRARSIPPAGALPDLFSFDLSGSSGLSATGIAIAQGVAINAFSEQLKQVVGKADADALQQHRKDKLAAMREHTAALRQNTAAQRSSARALRACREEQRAARAVQERILKQQRKAQAARDSQQASQQASQALMAKALAKMAGLPAAVPAADDE